MHQEFHSSLCATSNQENLVKKVVDYKLVNGKRYYKVKWKCTWELEDNLLPAQELVDQFWGFVNRVKSEAKFPPAKHQDDFNDTKKDIRNIIPNRNAFSYDSNIKSDYYSDQRYLSVDHENSNERTFGSSKSLDAGTQSEHILAHPTMVEIHRSVPLKSLYKPALMHHPSSLLKRSYITMNNLAEKNKVSVAEVQHEETCIEISPKDDNYTSSVEVDSKIGLANFNLHMLETEDRRFRCDVCGMAFKRKDMCRRHLRTHSNDFCYFCALCKKGFIRRYVLVKHLVKEHQTDDQSHILSTKRKRKEESKHHSAASKDSVWKSYVQKSVLSSSNNNYVETSVEKHDNDITVKAEEEDKYDLSFPVSHPSDDNSNQNNDIYLEDNSLYEVDPLINVNDLAKEKSLCFSEETPFQETPIVSNHLIKRNPNPLVSNQMKETKTGGYVELETCSISSHACENIEPSSRVSIVSPQTIEGKEIIYGEHGGEGDFTEEQTVISTQMNIPKDNVTMTENNNNVIDHKIILS